MSTDMKDADMAVAVPLVAMTRAELHTALWKPTIEERLEYISGYMVDQTQLVTKDPIAITKILEIFAIATNDVKSLEPQDRYEKRKLFTAAEWALICLQDDILMRLEVDLSEIDLSDVEQVEKVHRHLDSTECDFDNAEANLRYDLLRTLYGSILSTPPDEEFCSLAKLSDVQNTILTMVGEPVRYKKEDGTESTMSAFRPSEAFSEEELKPWKKRMTKFAIGLLITLAEVTHRKFNLQSLALLDTRLPVSVFISKGDDFKSKAGEYAL